MSWHTSYPSCMPENLQVLDLLWNTVHEEQDADQNPIPPSEKCKLQTLYGKKLRTFQWWNISVPMDVLDDVPVAKELFQKHQDDYDDNNEVKIIMHLLIYATAISWRNSFTHNISYDRIIGYSFKKILDLFTTNASHDIGITNYVYTKQEIISLFRLSFNYILQTPKVKSLILERLHNDDKFVTLGIPTAAAIVAKLDVEYVDNSAFVTTTGATTTFTTTTAAATTTTTTNNTTHQNDIFNGGQIVNACMYKYFDENSLINEKCSKAIKEANTLYPYLPETYAPQSDGVCDYYNTNGLGSFSLPRIILIYMYSCLGIILWTLFHRRESLKKQMDKRRQQLQQELDDPFLRSSLASRINDPGQRQQAIVKMECKIANWDSKAAAIRLLRKYVRRFRISLIVLASLWTIVWWLILTLRPDPYYGGEYRVACTLDSLDNAIVPLMLLAVTYTIPMHMARGDSLEDNPAMEMIESPDVSGNGEDEALLSQPLLQDKAVEEQQV